MTCDLPSARCAHCRAALPPGCEDGFCCRGCRAARALVESAGLERYYALASGTGTPGDAGQGSWPWLATIIEAARAASGDPARVTITLDVQGLHCAACVWLLQALFKRLPGGHHLAVNPGLGRIGLTIDPARFPIETYLGDLARVGYRTGPPCRDGRATSDGLGVRLGITIAIAMNAMALSLATYFGLDASDPDGLYGVFGVINLVLSTAALAVAGPVFFRGAWHALRRKSLHLDVPIALGVGLAWLGSVILFFSGRPELAYFDTLDVFLALMLLGRWAQGRLLDRGRRMLLADDGFALARAKVVEPSGVVTPTPLADLRAGTRILVAPGELLPVAATLEGSPATALTGQAGPSRATLEGDATAEFVAGKRSALFASEFDLAWMTGESDPVAFETGRTIPAGAHLIGPHARVVTLREPFSASALHQLLAASKSKGDASRDAPAQGDDRFWHLLGLAWVLTVLAFAGITAALWSSDPLLALRHATAVLVVTCPCAIGLATPLAYELAQQRLRREGLLPRRPGLLDRARHIRHVVFDKTGTLTLTELALANPDALDALTPAQNEALWQLTARSNHPKSRAIHATLAPAVLDETFVVTEIAGRGLLSDRVTLEGDGKDLVFRDLLAGTDLARFRFGETLRPEARAEIARLHDAGLQVHIASGDAPATVAAIAAALRVPPERAHGALTPEAKAALVTRLGPSQTLVLGDGINDTLAFDAATLAGTPALDRPALPARADFVLLGAGLGPLAALVQLAHHTRRLTLRNVAIASAYNALALTAGLAGWLSPVVAAVAMPVSSIIVVGLTLASARRPTHGRLPTPQQGTSLWMPST